MVLEQEIVASPAGKGKRQTRSRRAPERLPGDADATRAAVRVCRRRLLYVPQGPEDLDRTGIHGLVLPCGSRTWRVPTHGPELLV